MTASDSAEASRPADGSGLVDVGGGRRLFARWMGLGLEGGWEKGVPAIVFEAGLTDTHRSWEPVFEEIARIAPVVAYDRAGRGKSEARPHPELAWTGADIADDLIRVVRKLKVERRLVIVGHSFGGLVARLAVERYPAMVVGLVLVDASHEDAHESYLRILSGEAREEYSRRIAANPEGIDFPATCEQARGARPLRGRPLTVIARGQLGQAPPGWPPESELMPMWRGLQERLAALSPISRLVVAERSGHYVHRDEPELVVDAVRRAAEEATSWTPREPSGMRVRCLVPDPGAPTPAGPRVLLLRRAGEPPWELPTVESPTSMWIAARVSRLAREVEKRLGGRFVVLRHLHEAETEENVEHVAVLEAQDVTWAMPDDARWATSDELRALDLDVLAGSLAAAEEVARWLDEQTASEEIGEVRPPWERLGWVVSATAWADQELGRLGLNRNGPPEQIKGAWSGSAILRLPTNGGDLYLKETYARPPGEGALLSALAERHAGWVPETVAVDQGGRRMLMRDFGKGRLYRLPVTAWEESARRFALLQLDCASELERWLEMGCELRRPSMLPDLFKGLIEDRAIMGTGTATGLTEIELAGARTQLPELRRLCDALDGSGIPLSLVQQDFREGNLAVGEVREGARRFIYYDWSDTVVSHPFFSGIRMLDYISRSYESPLTGPSGIPTSVTFSAAAHKRYIRDAYLEPWTLLLPETKLREVFDLALRLSPLWQTVRWYRELPYYEPTSPWSVSIARWIPGRVRGMVRSGLSVGS